jgi:hypothetical protein
MRKRREGGGASLGASHGDRDDDLVAEISDVEKRRGPSPEVAAVDRRPAARAHG